ncbi:hypothetical protein MIR68_012511 [Amoeboaphelidium protococcarum]|nr:hypothetical protein MIR68_012511 [Amoeboaphelidium protococcarum]
MLFKISELLAKQIKHYASFPQTGVSLRQMVEFGQNPSQGTLLKAAMFLQDELPIRLAHRVVELENLPHGLSDMPSVIKVKNWYAESFQELIEFPKMELPQGVKTKYRSNGSKRYHILVDDNEPQLPSNVDTFNSNFTQVIEGIKRRHDPVVQSVATGILELKNFNRSLIMDSAVQSFLDRFYMSRIGIRMLIGQHIALNKGQHRPGYVGVICTKTNVAEIAQDAIDNSRFICEDYYGLFKAPEIKMYCPKDLEFMYVPSHLHHMLFELLKNSLRAVVETHGLDSDAYPRIKLIVAEGKEDITVKISDEGGGIPRSEMNMVWTYLYTTAKAPAMDPNSSQSDFKAPLAGFGYGLPLSRLYARYFGGDLRLISMEGYGTDAYLHLARLSDNEEPLP